MDEPNSPVIHTEGLSKTFKGVKALDSLNLQVPKNSIFGFLGPNGAGKSTTIKLMLGLIRPGAGKATVFGQDTQTRSVEIRRKNCTNTPPFFTLPTSSRTCSRSAIRLPS